jgi:uncharacterized phage-associated protein
MKGGRVTHKVEDIAVAALLASKKHGASPLRINKWLYYTDALALLETGAQLSPSKYVPMKNGPVIDDGWKLIGLKSDPRINVVDSFHIRLASDAVQNPLDASDFAIVSEVVRKFEGMSDEKLSDYSHENPGWSIHWNDRGTSQVGTKINMILAIQQLVTDDLWMKTEELSSSEKQALLHLESAGETF